MIPFLAWESHGPCPAVMISLCSSTVFAPVPSSFQNSHSSSGFGRSMYIGNVILIILNLPLVGIFVNLLRVPFRILFPIILLVCIAGRIQ